MIKEAFKPDRIKDLLYACASQEDMIRRLIVEAEPGFQSSRLMVLLGSRRWACAVNPNLLVDRNSVSDQFARADAILHQVVGVTLEGKRFLDFGCGLGYVTRAANRMGATAIGYDLVKQWKEDPCLVDDWDAVLSRAPYDIILVYDVLDHTQEHPIDCLQKIKSVLSPGGSVYIRFHPWCSRSGNHSYIHKNKAYIHYFFSPEQLEDMGAPGIWVRKINHPVVTYNDWILKSGFTKISEDVRREPVEPLWEEEPVLRTIVQDHWKDSFEESLATGAKFPKYQMEIQFVTNHLNLG